MKQLTDKVAQALTNLRASADFRVLMEHLREDEAEELVRCRDLDGVALHRAQGAAKKLSELTSAYAEAPEVLKKYRNRQTG